MHYAARQMSAIPLRCVYCPASRPNRQSLLEKVKRLVLAIVDMGRQAASRRDKTSARKNAPPVSAPVRMNLI